MIIIPAIDIVDGKCVRLKQGKAEEKTVYSDSPVEMAKRWQKEGASFLHIVDLDGAFGGKPANKKTIGEIIKNLNIDTEVGGGIRSFEHIEEYLSLGARRVVVGTSACENAHFARDAYQSFKDRVIIAVDTKDGFVVKKGWLETSQLKVEEFVRDLKKIGFEEIIYTDILKDGMLEGPNIKACEDLLDATGIKIVASGGISTLEDVKRLSGLAPKGISAAIIGKALYDGKLNLRDITGAANAG